MKSCRIIPILVLVLRAQGLFLYITINIIPAKAGIQGLEDNVNGRYEMATEKKMKIVESLQETFSRARAGVLTDYRGLTTASLSELRGKFREAGIEYKVVKNSLAQLAVRQAGLSDLDGVIVGPMAIAFDFSDSPAVAKILTEYIRSTKSILGIKGGFLADRVLTPQEVETLAKLPSKQVLISQLMAGIQSPLYGLVNVLAGPIRGIMGVLQARIKQLEGA
jgi:large subunit ribosomal protein L10